MPDGKIDPKEKQIIVEIGERLIGYKNTYDRRKAEQKWE